MDANGEPNGAAKGQGTSSWSPWQSTRAMTALPALLKVRETSYPKDIFSVMQ